MSVEKATDLLKNFQREVYDDPARFVAWIAARQIGKSFTGGGLCNKWANEKPRNDVLIASPSERQSLEAIEKCKQWAEANDLAIKDVTEERDAPGALIKKSTITFPNESRIIAVPGKPETVRGFTANVWIDEFAFLENPNETWKAILPCISNQLKGKKRIFVTSTPNGRNGQGKKFWQIVTNDGQIDPEEKTHYNAGLWSVHRTPIFVAAKEIPVDIDELRAVNDNETWEQEFCCNFIDGSSVMFTYDLLTKCESEEATTDPSEVLDDPHGLYYGGLDFGSSKDPSVLWLYKKIAERRAVTKGVIVTRGNTVEQFRQLKPYMQKCQRICVDYTGVGTGFGDLCATELTAAKTKEMDGTELCELCQFTEPFKAQLFPEFKTALENGEIILPIDSEYREDFHAVQQIIRNGKYHYEAPRTKEGHSDRCTAGALGRRALKSAVSAAAEPPDEEVPHGYKYRRGWN